jgi:hypothetical protein
MRIREQISNGATTYVVWICGEERVDGTWEAWLEFHPTDATQPILRTDQETSQPSSAAIDYWAQGLSRSTSKARWPVPRGDYSSSTPAHSRLTQIALLTPVKLATVQGIVAVRGAGRS